jgi:hypothetical protein
MIRSFDRRTGGYGYIVQAEKIRRLANTWDYAAKLTKMVRYRESAPADTINHHVLPFHEHYGVTPEEAAAKAIAQVDDWINAQSRSDKLKPDR